MTQQDDQARPDERVQMYRRQLDGTPRPGDEVCSLGSIARDLISRLDEAREHLTLEVETRKDIGKLYDDTLKKFQASVQTNTTLREQLDAAKEREANVGTAVVEAYERGRDTMKAENEKLKATLRSLGVTTYGELNRPVSGDET